MPAWPHVVAVTGASGYLGSHISETLEATGWHVVRLARAPGRTGAEAVPYDLAMPISDTVREALQSADALIHAAYDMELTARTDIWRINVEGTRRLLEAACDAGVSRIIVLSSMSAFEGTTQRYGRAKLEIEAIAAQYGGCAVRPGLVHGEEARGMAGALSRLTSLPMVPVISGGAGVYTVREQDLMTVISLLASSEHFEPGTISVAHPSRVALADLLGVLAAQAGRRCRCVPVPWRLVYWLLTAGEAMRLRLPFRADSVLGLVHAAPALMGAEHLARLGVTVTPFPADERRAPAGLQ